MATEPKKQEPDIMPPIPDVEPGRDLPEIPQDKDMPEKKAPEGGVSKLIENFLAMGFPAGNGVNLFLVWPNNCRKDRQLSRPGVASPRFIR
jgi:hypothetical protein